ncbi:UPF0045 protein ECM15 [Lachnellula arida]|uniref:UPF0045 protein ECM15 n=1 Tax=Lachnellula arida TaxID=1316785 RepID=A0A8T9B4Y3_9HELO|nr:UPF0045 protein ECM15 [Lachnellula arida]
MDYVNLPTPPVCVADFCLVPIGTPTASVSNEVAAVQRLMKASGLEYSMHSAGTTVEGEWDAVMKLIGQAHTLVHQNGVVRIQSDIRVGTRTDKKQHFSEKVTKVENILAADGKVEEKVVVVKPEESKEVEKVVKPVAEEPKNVEVAKEPKPEEKKQPLTPATNQGTWASMFRK